MNNSAVDEIKEKLSIEEVVSSYIKLEKTGINMRACCPFHNEKTPSFFVSPDRGSFYCFGCSKGGDIFTFVEEIEGVDFKGALNILAEKAGVDLSKFQVSNMKSKKIDDTLYTILEKATMFFERELEKHSTAKDYLKGRGIEDKIISKFRIGYAKDEWQTLYDYLKSEKYDDNQILQTGLVVKNEKGRVYDRFRGRVIFPIFDERGKTIAYSARILPEPSFHKATNGYSLKDQPKYINSPETALFNKSKILYGFNFAKQTIRKHDFAILVEGQLDVIMAHQVGYSNTVASSGTAFTEDQLKIIKRHTDNLLIAFDGDSAGIKSSKKVWELALQNEMDVKILPLRGGQDPADIISNDPNAWRELVKQSKHIIEHLAENIKTSVADKRKQQKLVQIEIYPYIKSIKSYTDKSFFVEKLSEMFGIDRDAIWSDVNSNESQKLVVENKEEKRTRINPKEILYGIYLSQTLKDKGKFLEEISKYISSDLISEMGQRRDKVLFEVDLLLDQYGDLSKLVSDMYSKLKIDALEKDKINLNEQLNNVSEGSDNEDIIMKKLVEISREIETVKKKGCLNFENVI